MRRYLPLLLSSLALSAVTAPAQAPVRITADLSDVGRRLLHAEIDLPVKAGHGDYITPQWIPGTHMPSGPVEYITGVVFTANGQKLPWRRDDVDLYEYHVDVPKGVDTIHAHLDFICTDRVSDHIAVLEWEKLMLYPAHIPVRNIPIQPTVTIPAGWGIGTALTPVSAYDPNQKTGGSIQFQPTTVEQLEDSPVIAGDNFHEFPLAPDVAIKHYIDVVSDEPGDEMLRPELLAEVSSLVRETGAAYNARHYNAYHFLLTLSDTAGGEGLEHGQSSDNGVDEKAFESQESQLDDSDLLAHEFTHSWNGKYRRPDRLYQPDFSTPEVGELLWVYEGLTQYMGNVLAARSGLKNQQQYREMLAASAAQLDYKSGREWRSTDDTAIAASVLRSGSPGWSNWKRGQDYYQEGELLWLDADTLIRDLTKDQKSLTDFLHIFEGKGGNTGPLIVTYNRQELIDGLNQVVKYDWARFLHDRVDVPNPRADLDGITRGGWKLVYEERPTASSMHGRAGNIPNIWYSLGIRISGDGVIQDVRWGSPAFEAKLAPGQQIVSINNHKPSGLGLHEALTISKATAEPIHLLIEHNDGAIKPVDINYHGGERFPNLVRDAGKPDYLDEITKPLAAAPTK